MNFEEEKNTFDLLFSKTLQKKTLVAQQLSRNLKELDGSS
jgi:hypothetical protein